MAKKKPKSKQEPAKPDPTSGPSGGKPSGIAPSLPGVRVTMMPGVPICIDPWDGGSGIWTSATATTICVFEWIGDAWKFIRPLIKGHSVIQPEPLDKVAFPGRYKGERVLAVYTPPAKPGY